MLPKLCHLDNDLEIIIITYTVSSMSIFVYTARSTQVLHTLPGDIFFSHGTPVWPWPVILVNDYYNYIIII